MRSDFFIKTIFAALGMLPILPVQADIDEIFRLSIGATFDRFDTDIRFNSKDGSIGTGIDFEDDVGFNSEVATPQFNAWYRVGDNHRISLTFTPIHRTTFLVTSKDITVGDDTIKAGASMAWDNRNDIFDLSYIYSIYRRPNLEIGVSAGVYWLRTETRVLVAGEVQSINDPTAVFRSEYRNDFKLEAPLPIFGLRADYEIIPSWRAYAGVRYFSVTIDEYDGSLFAAELGTEYYFTESFGLGVSLASFSLDVEVTSIILNGSLAWRYNSGQVYIVYKY